MFDGVAALDRLGGPDRDRRLRLGHRAADPGQPAAGQERLGAGLLLGQLPQARPGAAAGGFKELLRWQAEGRIRPHVSQTLPLAQAKAALERLLARQSTGKVVLTMDERM